MTHKEAALNYFNEGFLCSQSVLAAFSKECGLTEEQALKLGACFGTGMKKGEVCGACTGALMVLGALYGHSDAHDPAAKSTAYAVNDKMTERFAGSCGSYICSELLGCDITTPEGAAYALENRLFTEFCPKMVASAADILEEIIAEQENKREVCIMPDVYKSCPTFENGRYRLRFVREQDADELLEVYSDKNALPFFNSDNCDGDNFYYPTRERMLEAIEFWLSSYENGWFVRFAIIDKALSKAIGTIELFRRESDDAFGGDGVLRLDVKSGCEKENVLFDILSLAVPPAFDLFGCDEIITKAPIYAVERIKALTRYGFTKSEHNLIGTNDRYAYNGYWTVKKR